MAHMSNDVFYHNRHSIYTQCFDIRLHSHYGHSQLVLWHGLFSDCDFCHLYRGIPEVKAYLNGSWIHCLPNCSEVFDHWQRRKANGAHRPRTGHEPLALTVALAIPSETTMMRAISSRAGLRQVCAFKILHFLKFILIQRCVCRIWGARGRNAVCVGGGVVVLEGFVGGASLLCRGSFCIFFGCFAELF